MNMKTKRELQLLHSAHKQLSLSHMPVHVIDYPIAITIFQSQLPITSYVVILNYNYHYHYLSKVINCQLQHHCHIALQFCRAELLQIVKN